MKKLLSGLFALAVLAGALALPHAARAADLALDGNLRGGCSTTAASGGAATLANKCGVVTSEALTTAIGSEYTLTLTNSIATTTDLILASVQNGTSTTGRPVIGRVQPGAGQVVITVFNESQGMPFNGTIKITYFIIKP